MTRLKHETRERRNMRKHQEQMASGIQRKSFFKKHPPINIANAVITFLLHIAVTLLIVYSYQYYGLSKTTFICALGILVCLLIITDLLLFVGNNYHDKVIRIVNICLAGVLLIISTYGAVTMFKLSSSVNKMLENSGSEQYEEISVVYVSYDSDYSELEDINGMNVGILYETSVGTSSLGLEKLDSKGIEYDTIQCSTINDLFYGLIEGTIDVAVMPGSYRQIYENDSDYDYTDYLNKMNDFCAFSEKVKVDENENANKDLTTEPFNILLIGFAQNNATSSYGLADTIIVATVNPQTMTVSLTSIPRDSFVPISCYGGSKDKINAARGTSRACLMDTVSDLLDMDIDFYMEVNFEAVVDIVDALGGILIDSPVSFVGQNSSYTRGEMTVYVEAGPHYALGEEVLAFARERHAMPNGDFDRQQHQQEVIKEIARELINLRDVNKALKVMEACGDNISTNLSMEQLTGIFNYIITAPNYMNIDQFSLIDIHNMRMTGYSSWHYNEQLELPVWIYKLYDGSVEDITMRINENLGIYEDIDQDCRYYFFADNCAVDQVYYKTEFDEEEVHETLPLYCPYLTNMSYSEADAWAQKNGINLNVTFVTTGYGESAIGMVVDQGTNYGKKLSAGDTINITVYGVDETKCVPNFVGKSYLEAVSWANEKNYTVTLQEVSDGVEGKGGTVISQTPTANSLIEKYNTLVIKYYALATLNANNLVGKTKDEVTSWANTYMYYPDTITYKNLITEDSTKVGKVASATFSSGTTSKSTDKTLVVTMYVKAQEFEIKVTAEPSEGGTVSGGGKLSNANNAKITAAVNTGYKFLGWYNGTTQVGTELSYSFLPEKDITYTAKFEKLKTYKVSASAGTGGTATCSPSGEVTEGTTVTFTATASEGYTFSKWIDDGSTDATHTITVKEDVSLTAEFAIRNKYTLTFTAGEGGSVDPTSKEEYEGSTVTVTATPKDGYHFKCWEDDSSASATRTITVTASVTYTATFEKDAETPQEESGETGGGEGGGD